MIKKTITYINLDGKPVTEEFHFHYSKAELVEQGLVAGGPDQLQTKLRAMIASGDTKAILDKFKEIISDTVGKRSEDGKRFIKTQEIRDEFMETEAYGTMLVELFSNPTAAAEFIRGIVPADLSAKISTKELDALRDTPTMKGLTPKSAIIDEAYVDIDQVVANAQMASKRAFDEAKAEQLELEQATQSLEADQAAQAAGERTKEDYTDEELLTMPKEQFNALVGTDAKRMGRRYLQIAFQRRMGE